MNYPLNLVDHQWVFLGGSLTIALGLWKLGTYIKSHKEKRYLVSDSGDKPRILITGGASGIGFQTALKFLSHGWIVGIYDLNISRLEERILEANPDLANSLSINLKFKEFDVTNIESCKSALDHFTQDSDRKFDVLFNCAGLLYVGPFDQGLLAVQKKMIQVNCEGLMQMAYLSLDYLKRKPGSCIVQMASISSIGGVPNHGVYSSTKAFVWSLTDALRSELMCHRIRVCDVSVAFVNTPMVQNQKKNNYSSIYKTQLEEITPLEVANTVYRAVHTCSYYNTHFFVRRIDEVAFRAGRLFQSLWPAALTFINDLLGLLEFQKTIKI